MRESLGSTGLSSSCSSFWNKSYFTSDVSSLMLILHRIAVFTFLLFLTYFFLIMAFQSEQTDKRDVSVGVLGASAMFEPNLTAMFSASPVRSLKVYVVSSDGFRLLRMVRMLENAGYPKYCDFSVDLVVIVVPSFNASGLAMNWSHGVLSFSSVFSPVKNESLVLVLDDAMEISPFFAFWFLLQWNASLVSGGGGQLSPVGLALGGRLWNGVIGATGCGECPLPKLFEAVLAVCNCSAVFPSLGDGRVFVRREYQSPVQAERFPRLVRTWNYSRSQWNI